MEDQNKKLVAEVQELLSQVALKLKDVKDLEIDQNDYGSINIGGAEEIYDDETDNYIENPNLPTEDEKYLFSVKDLCRNILKSQYSAVRVLEKYYTSIC